MREWLVSFEHNSVVALTPFWAFDKDYCRMVEGERGGEGDEREGKGGVKVKGKKGGEERETRGGGRQEAQLLRTSYQGHY